MNKVIAVRENSKHSNGGVHWGVVVVQEIRETPLEEAWGLLSEGYKGYELKGDLTNAYRLYTQAIKILTTQFGDEPKDDENKLILAGAYLLRGLIQGCKEIKNKNAALKDIERAKKLDPKNTGCHISSQLLNV